MEVVTSQAVFDSQGILAKETADNMLSGFGNHEAKALLLMAMAPLTPYTSDDLHKLHLKIQDGTVAWKTDRRLQFNYCQRSLEPIGMVALASEDSGTGAKIYYVTPFGHDVGRAYAGQMTDMSLNSGVSLQIFGRTNTSGDGESRPPVDCLEIVRFLISQDIDQRVTDIAEAFPELKSLRAHLLRLDESGLIHFESPGETLDVSYSRTGEFGTDLNERPFVTTKVGQFVLETVQQIPIGPDQSLTISGIEMSYKNDRIASSGSTYDRRVTRGIIASSLASLMRQGVLTRTSAMHAKKRSNIHVDEVQRETLTTLVKVAQPARSFDHYRLEGQRKADAVLAHPSQVRALLIQAKNNSCSANPSTPQDTQLIIDILIDSGPLSTAEIHKQYSSTTEGKPLTRPSVANILKRLELSSRAVGVKDGRRNMWRLVEPFTSSEQI